MIHEKINLFPYGMTADEAKLLMVSEDVYEVLETFDSLEDALNFIKKTYGIKAYEYAKEDSKQSINEKNEVIDYKRKNGDTNYITYASFDISDNIENYRKGKRYEPSFFWFPSGKIVRVELY